MLGEKPAPVPFCPPRISHGPARDQTRPSAVTAFVSHDSAMLAEIILHYVQTVSSYLTENICTTKTN